MSEEQEKKALKQESQSKKVKLNVDSTGSQQNQRPSLWDLLDVLWWI